MAIPYGDPHHKRLPWWSQLPLQPKIPTLPSYHVDPQYPEHLLPYVRPDQTLAPPYAAPSRSFSDFLNEDGSLKSIGPGTPTAGGLLGIIEQYLRSDGHRRD